MPSVPAHLPKKLSHITQGAPANEKPVSAGIAWVLTTNLKKLIMHPFSLNSLSGLG
jgi:hypothetical protein